MPEDQLAAEVAPQSSDPFDALGAQWHAISARLITARRLVAGLLGLIPLAMFVAPLVAISNSEQVPRWLVWAVLGVWVVAMAWVSWLIPRQVRAWAYAERAEELLVRRGLLFRRIVVVPYGRLQYVDVSAGPLARRFGYASVQLHTASPGSDAQIPGVPAEDAARLRERLTARGQAQLAGL